MGRRSQELNRLTSLGLYSDHFEQMKRLPRGFFPLAFARNDNSPLASGSVQRVVWAVFGLKVVTGPPQKQKNTLHFCSRRGTEKNVFYCSGARGTDFPGTLAGRGRKLKPGAATIAADLRVWGAGRLI